MKTNNSSTNFIAYISLATFFAYTVLSWILLFRDPRALIGITNLYPLSKTFFFSTQTMLAHFGLNSIPTILFAVVSVVAITCYIIALKQKINLKKTIIFALLFQLVTVFSYPILSTDIFSYIFSERVATVHHENIWKVKPATFPDDQFGVLADWKDTTSVYGAAHYILYLGPSYVGQNNLVMLVILYKIIPALFGIGSMFVLYKILSLFKLKDSEKLLRLIFWNPLLILELFGSAHNDSLMLFFALSAFYFFAKKNWLLSGILLGCATQVKLIPVVLFAYCFLALLRHKRFVPMLLFFSGYLSINALAFSFMQVNILEFMQRVNYNGGVYWQSLQTLVQTFLPGKSSYIIIFFLLWLVVFTILQFKKKQSPVISYATVILTYLIFVSAAYWNWYILWVFVFIPFTNKKIAFSALLLTMTSLFAYPLLWTIQRINTPSVIWPILTYIFIFGIPILGYLFASLQKNQFEKFLKKINLQNLIAEKVSDSV